MLISIDSFLNDDMVFFYVLRGVAVIMALLAIGTTWSTIRFLIRSKKADGTLVNWEKVQKWDRRSGGNSGVKPTYLASVMFAGDDGKEYQVTAKVLMRERGGKPRRPLGAKMPVRYIPDHPDQARVSTIVDLWFRPFMSSAIGVVLLWVCFHQLL